MSKQFCCLDKTNFYEMCSHCYNAYFSDPEFEAALHDAYWTEQDNKAQVVKACECGGSSVADNTHSAWCPKFVDDNNYYGTD